MAYFELNNTVGSGAIATTGGAYTYDYWLDVTMIGQTTTGSKLGSTIRVKTWLKAGYARFEQYWCTDSISINGYVQPNTFSNYYSLPTRNEWYAIQTYDVFIEHADNTDIVVTTNFSGPGTGDLRPGSATATVSGTLSAIWTSNGNDLTISTPTNNFTNWEGKNVDIAWTGPTLGINNHVILYHTRISEDGNNWKTLNSDLATSYVLKESDFTRLGLPQQDSYYLQIEAIPAYGNSTKSTTQTINWNWAPVNAYFTPESISWNIDEVNSPEFTIDAENPNTNQTDAIFSQASAASTPIVGNEPPQMDRGKNVLTYSDLPKVSNAILDTTGFLYIYGASIKTVQEHERYSNLASAPLILTSTQGYHFNDKPFVDGLEVIIPHTYIGGARLKNTIETIVLSSYLNGEMVATKEITRTYGADEISTVINFFDLLQIDLTKDSEYTFSVKCIEGGREIECSKLVFSYTAPVVDVNMYAEYGESPRFLAYQKNPFATTMQFPILIQQSSILETIVTVYLKAYVNRQQNGQATTTMFSNNSYAPAIDSVYSTMQTYTLGSNVLYCDFAYYYTIKYNNHESIASEQPITWIDTDIQKVQKYVGSKITLESDPQQVKTNFFDGDVNSLFWQDMVLIPKSTTFKLLDATPVMEYDEVHQELAPIPVNEIIIASGDATPDDLYIKNKETNIKYSEITDIDSELQYQVVGQNNLGFGMPVNDFTNLKPNAKYKFYYVVKYGELYYHTASTDEGESFVIEPKTVNTKTMEINIFSNPVFALTDTATLSRRSDRYDNE